MIVEVDVRDLMSLLKGNVSLEELIDGLNMFGTPVDEVEENTIRVEVAPNRLDMLSTEGIARSLNGFFGFDTGLPVMSITSSTFEVEVKGSSVRPFVGFSTVHGVKFTEPSIKSIMQMQEKLHISAGRNRRKYSIGLYDLDRIKPPIRYVDMPLDEIHFVPLDEEEEMSGREILEKTEKGKRYAHLLGDRAPVLIDARNRIMSMAPVINADWCKVTEKTENVFIDSTGTSPGTDALVSLIATSLAERGGKIGVVIPGPTYLPKRVDVSFDEVRRIIGMDLKDSEIRQSLEKMRYAVENGAVVVPAYRLDVSSVRDVAEDAAIGYGYQRISQEIPSSNLFGVPLLQAERENMYRRLLVGYGFTEVKTFVLTSSDLLELAGSPHIRVQNPKTQEATTLRQSLLPGLLDILERNKDVEYPQRIFEVGPVFLPEQKIAIAGMIAHRDSSFAEIKGVVDSFLSINGIKLDWTSGSHPFFIEGRTAVAKGGVYGEVRLDLASRVGMPLAAFELILERDL